jgi:hypothetical protein
MANYTSKYTGTEIDLAVASGSSATGVIKDFNTLSGSSTSTLSVGGNTTLGNASGDIHHFRGIITASNRIFGLDEILLKDGTVSGDTLIRQYASGDDGVIDIYENNTPTIQLKGGGGHISASGNISGSRIVAVDEIQLKDGSGGDTLVRQYASNDDGIIDVYQNNAVKISLDGRGGHITASGNISGSGTLDISSNANIDGNLDVDGYTNLDGLTVAGVITASGKIESYDEFKLRDGSGTGDLLIRGYASSDDGIIDVYQNNAVKTRLHGNGLSYFDGGNVVVGTTSDSGKKLTVAGDISASGNIIVNNITASGHIGLGEDKRIHFEADKATWIETDSTDRLRVVVGGSQMMVWDQDDSRAVFGNGVKVYIGSNNNAQPSTELEVAGDISASGVIEGFNRTKVLSATADLPLNVSSSGAIVVPSGGARTITLPPVATCAGVSFEIRAGSAHQHIVSQSGGDGTKKIFGHVIDNANGSSAAGAGGTVTEQIGTSMVYVKMVLLQRLNKD